jgi:hypothetical protein
LREFGDCSPGVVEEFAVGTGLDRFTGLTIL